ncbi:hypothetical protein HG535_0H03440 [Zygotorulaspora mrakii]|uniref:Uncharacterized protein n=1 Tax=Zygotorulaspora mrakii TaxID=42260 RepID=A0A7H9B8S8_ZYGMR|nr:uncharacterized protein HG535_0H03440 [Zygotorulaspora mrakii]QLG75017.1 hypothetical protein HG535_0H03440 [Zygotorulaspora mrakii]
MEMDQDDYLGSVDKKDELTTLTIFGTRPGSMSVANEPPTAFLRTIENGKIMHSKTCSFIIYSISYPNLTTSASEKLFQPFQLFKDCYNRNKRRQDAQYQLANYFSLTSLQKSFDDGADNSFEGSTMLLDNSNQHQKQPELCIFPEAILFDKSTGHLKTVQHIQEYENRFETVLKKFNEKRISHLYINWMRLLESYVELVFRDLAVKWCHWLHSVRAARHRQSIQMTLRTRLPELCRIFWQKYFIFQNSSRQPINEFSSELLRKILLKARQKNGKSYSKISFGLWLDSKNGILIMGNGVYFGKEPSLKNVHVIPTAGICLDRMMPKDVTSKLLLFINLAIIECFYNEA